MRQTLAVAAMVGVALGSPRAGLACDNGSVEEVAERYWDAVLERFPTRATEAGDYRFDDRLEDVSERGRRVWQAKINGLLADLNNVRGVGESEAVRLNRRLLERAMRDAVASLACLGHYMPLDPLDGKHIKLPLILVSQPFRNRRDFENYVKRLKAFPIQVSQMIENMRRGTAMGLVHPAVIVERVIPQIRRHIVDDVTRSVFYEPVERMEALSAEDREPVRLEIVSAIRAFVVPAYLRLLAYVEDEALVHARSTVGISGVPDGEKIYGVLAFLNMTVRMPVDEVHQLGLSEVARIRGEMGAMKETIGFAGSLEGFITNMRRDPHHRFSSRVEILGEAEAFLNRSKRSVGPLFGRLPRAEIVMKEIEPFRAASSPMAYYGPIPGDGSRPGYFYINTYQPADRLRFTLEALSYHESIPGHHLQIALDVENKRLPRFRRYYGNFTAYVEGWALYAEKLGYEMGGYTDPYQRFGQLTLEMWRACRLVVDTGLHVRGWSRRRAIDYLAENTCLSLPDIEAEVDRYIAWPGQALAYKVGELRILALRKEAKQALGERFSLPAFHDALLSGGAMPIDLLEQRLRSWMKNASN